jgi:hypothetical protein
MASHLGALGSKILSGTVVLALIGCASAPGGPEGDAQVETASLTLFHPRQLPPQAPQQESLCAPIALYADPLLAQVLMAAGHQSDIAAAARWIGQHPRAQLGQEITISELHDQHWDPSVESLLAVPELLLLMDAQRQWAHQLADTFRTAPLAMMDAVQRLRRRALLEGSLQSSPEQTVSTDGQIISIEPAQPDVLFVPYYWPRVVFGAWPWPATLPYSFSPPANVVFAGASLAFGVPVNLTTVPWRWYHWDWQHHRLEPLAS